MICSTFDTSECIKLLLMKMMMKKKRMRWHTWKRVTRRSTEAVKEALNGTNASFATAEEENVLVACFSCAEKCDEARETFSKRRSAPIFNIWVLVSRAPVRSWN